MVPQPKAASHEDMTAKFTEIMQVLGGLTVAEMLIILMVGTISIARAAGVGIFTCLSMFNSLWDDPDERLYTDGPPTERMVDKEAN